MTDKALYGLLSGILLIVVTLVGVGLLNARPAESATADASRAGCAHLRAGEQHAGYAFGTDCTTAR